MPFVMPDVDQDTVITSLATLVSDNGPIRQASVSVLVNGRKRNDEDPVLQAGERDRFFDDL